MNIVIITAYYQPKLGYQQYFLAKSFIKEGHKCTVVTSNRYFPFPSYKLSYEKILGNRILKAGSFLERGIPTIRLKTAIELSSNATLLMLGLDQTVKSLNPDLIIGCNAFTPAGFQIANAVSKLQNKPFLILDSHAATFNTSVNDSFLKKLYFNFFDLLLKNKIIRNTDYFAPIGDSENLLLHETFEGNILSKVIPLGADAVAFDKNNKAGLSVRKKLNILNDEVVFMYAGKVSIEKDIDILISSFANISKKISKLKLLIVGNGSKDYIYSLKQLINKHENIKTTVIFSCFVNNQELPNYYNAADIGVWPGNLSITIQEAMATGLPVILPKIISEGQTSNHLALGNAATQFKRGDILDLSNKMLKLVQDKKERSFRSKNCYNLIRAKYSWDVIAQQYLDIYTVNRKKK